MNWISITNFGDSAVTIPIALAILVWLVLGRAFRVAAAWITLFGTGVLLVLSTKVAYIGWGVGVQQLDFTGISGHAMMSTAVFPTVGYFAGTRLGAKAALICCTVTVCLGVLIAFSRLALGLHSLSEVVVGCVLGGLIAFWSVREIRTHSNESATPLAFVLTVTVLLATLHSEHAPSDRLVAKVALYLSGRSTPFMSHGRWL